MAVGEHGLDEARTRLARYEQIATTTGNMSAALYEAYQGTGVSLASDLRVLLAATAPQAPAGQPGLPDDEPELHVATAVKWGDGPGWSWRCRACNDGHPRDANGDLLRLDKADAERRAVAHMVQKHAPAAAASPREEGGGGRPENEWPCRACGTTFAACRDRHQPFCCDVCRHKPPATPPAGVQVDREALNRVVALAMECRRRHVDAIPAGSGALGAITASAADLQAVVAALAPLLGEDGQRP